MAAEAWSLGQAIRLPWMVWRSWRPAILRPGHPVIDGELDAGFMAPPGGSHGAGPRARGESGDR